MKARLSASLAGLLTLSAFAAPLMLCVGATPGLVIFLSCEGEQVYTVDPCQPTRIEVSSHGETTELHLRLTGPQIADLTGTFHMVWNSSGFHDLGDSAATRCLVPENSTAVPGVWSFEVILPRQTAAGIWQAEVDSGDGAGVVGFQVSTAYWDACLISPAAFLNVTPGEISGTTARVAVSCNGQIRMTLRCGDLSTSSALIPAGNLYLDDDQTFSETQETGDAPTQMGAGPIPGPTVQAGVNREVPLHLFLTAPSPLMRGTVQGNISFGFEPLNDTMPLLADLYISALRDRKETYEPAQPVLIEHAADLDTASHGAGLALPLEFKLKQLQVLKEASVEVVRITLAHDIFLEDNQEKTAQLDALVGAIRSDGMKLMIADGAAEAYWNDPMAWSEFSNAFLHRVIEIASRYRPDYYVVVKEPIWYMGMNWTTPLGMLSETVNVEQWVNLTEHLCDAVKTASPQTRTGASITVMDAESRLYLAQIDRLQGMDFVGVDIYTLPELDMVEANVNLLTKPKWILETWDGHPGRQGSQAWRSTSSAEWIRMISNYAQSRGFEGMVTFYNLYLCYDRTAEPDNLVEIWSALDNRQESFYALWEIAAQ